VSGLPAAPAEEDARDACCAECGSLFHRTGEHATPAPLEGLGVMGDTSADEFPPGYDPAEADRLIGRDVPDAQ
jgi:hypothetical protein